MDSLDEATVKGSPPTALIDDEAPTWHELRVGRYVLVEPVGKGSFGSVWAAFDPELDRKVAIKIIYLRAGTGSSREGLSTRSSPGFDELLSEAQLPAQLAHPNIVAIHDVGWIDEEQLTSLGGSSGVGRSLYVVMEYLGGSTLAGWLAEGRHDSHEIVRTMIDAGRGLQAAHARGMVHLDFKPGNVMFGEDGRPRVLDFGLARVRRRGPVSESGSMSAAGTPSYMAPEQHLGGDPDERSDQFAFGVTLWEALWGERPFTAKDPGAMAKLCKLKLAGPPTLPRSRSVPAHVRTAIQRALAPKPEDRYPDMASLLAALEADPSAQRRRWLVGGALVAAVIAMIVGTSERRDVCELPDDRFAGIWDETVDAELSEAFSKSGIESADEVMARVRAGLNDQVARWAEVRGQVCESGKVGGGQPLEVMSEEFLCLEAHLHRITAVVESLRVADGETVSRAADSVAKIADPEDCLQARRGRAERVLDEDARARILKVHEILARAEAECALGRYGPALASADEALTRVEGVEDSALLGQVRLARSTALVKLGRHDEAADELVAALTAAELAGDEKLVIETWLEQLNNETEASRPASAELVAQLAEARLASGRLDDPELAIALDLKLSHLLFRQHRFDEARARAEQAFARQREHDPNDAPMAAKCHFALGNVEVESRSDLALGRTHYEAARELWVEAYGPIHPQVGAVMLNLGAIDFRTGRYEETLADLHGAAQIFAQVYPADHPNIGSVHQNIAAVYTTLGRYVEAIEPSERALSVSAVSFGKGTTKYAVAEHNHAGILTNLGRFGEALPLSEHALSVFEIEFEPGDGRRVTALVTMIIDLWALGRDDEAREPIERVEQLMGILDAKEPRRASGLYVLAEARLRAGKPEAALELVNELVAMIDAGSLAEPDPVADTAALLGKILRALGRLDEARARLETILDDHLGGTGENAMTAGWNLRLELGHVEREAGRADAAREHYDAAWRLIGGYEHAPTFGAEISLALASIENDPAKAKSQAEEALVVLRDAGQRPDLQAEAEALLDSQP